MHILPLEEHHRIERLLDEVPFNINFARSVVENDVSGTIFVDDAEHPRNAYILHPYGMSLLLGDAADKDFEDWLFPYLLDEKRRRAGDEWMQVHSDEWAETIRTRLSERMVDVDQADGGKDRIEIHQRVNFRFNPERFQAFRDSIGPDAPEVVRLDERYAGSVRGMVVPSAFWRDARTFLERGVGFSVIVDDEPVSTAFSAFVRDGVREIGIETREGHMGRGYATMASAAFIDHCIRGSLVPVWSCRLGNSRSYGLAIKLGFEPSLTLPFYRLCRH